MDALNQSLNAVAWWRVFVVGLGIGMVAAAGGLVLISKWAQSRPYMPGPFSRDGEYRMAPPRDDKA